MKIVDSSGDIFGKTVFVRADFNVPIISGKVAEDFRIKKAFKTINYLRDKGAKIILASHIESGEGSLKPVFEYLKDFYQLSFVEDYFPNGSESLSSSLGNGEIVLLENLRKYKEEKENNEAFAKHLAGLADFYVNEAFPASHRKHASIVGIPNFLPSFAGFVFDEEVRELSRALKPEHPFVFILGGAKFETKLPFIEKFFPLCDTMFIGGALANDFLRAKGDETGLSVVSDDKIDLSKFLSQKLILPEDVIVLQEDGERAVRKVEEVKSSDKISDIGPSSIKKLSQAISQSKFILWNGPLGHYENNFKEATLSLAKIISETEATSIVGGGDTVASIAELGLSDKFSFISSGGGAMLEFLANETLPGIEALKNN